VHWAIDGEAEDRAHDTPLVIEYPKDLSSGLITAVALPPGIFSDGFESGDCEQWSNAIGEVS
jgi:hypothetical protein